jgi:hypothetical protein
LEERLRTYETNGVQANIHLQKLAKKLDLENRKLKQVLVDACGISEYELERTETEQLVEEIKSKFVSGGVTATSPGTASTSACTPTLRPETIRSNSFSGGNVVGEGVWSAYSTPRFQTCHYPSAPLSDVRSQKPPTPPPTKEDAGTAHNLLLTLAPQTNAAPNCGHGLNSAGHRFCGLMQLLASESTIPVSGNKTVPCRVSYELLKSLVDEQDALAMENAVFELKDGVQLGNDGVRVDAKVLAKMIEKLTSGNNVDNKEERASERMMAVDV